MRNFIQHPKDALVTLASWGSALAILLAFSGLIVNLADQGYSAVSWSFLLEAPRDAGRSGGIFPIFVSTVLIMAVAMVTVIPFGLGTAILLSEISRTKSRFAKLTCICLDILASVPSIVFGLFGNAFFSIYLGLGYSILAGGLTLACMILPIFVRTVESGLTSLPQEMNRGAIALGLSKQAALWHLLLPAAAPSIAVGLILGTGRALAESAALIFTSGYVDRMPSSLTDSGRSLAVHIYDLSMNVTGGEHNAYASILILIVLLVTVNGLAFLLTEVFLHKRILRS
ncbi:phosphate ABC transporter permease PstA [Herbaspirillum sp. HC18]|nr:phosphate ABC transporter permease PstA [Herbaspirillum sp. HC18]